MTFKVSEKLKLCASLLGLSLILVPALVNADAKTNSDVSSSGTTASSTKTADQATRLSNIIAKGNEEIERRLGNLSGLTSRINDATKLTSADSTALTSEVNSTISGLNTLKTSLDSATTISAAANDVQDIFSEYRVYALVDPKVHLIKVTDDQLVAETNLQALATKLQTRITASSQSSALAGDMTTLNTDISNASTLTNSVENSGIINLQPTDYDTNHQVLEGYNTQLQTARTDIVSAYNEAKTIVTALTSSSSSSASSSGTSN